MRLRAAYLSFHRRANARFVDSGVTADQFVVLAVLAERPGLTQREIVERTVSDPNTVAALLRRLEAKSLIVREPHPVDGRARCSQLTPSGRRLHARLAVVDAELRAELEAGFAAAERQVLADLLDRVPSLLG